MLRPLLHPVASGQGQTLARSAAAAWRELQYENITLRTGDGHGGWPEHAPFDIVIVTAAPERIPQLLEKDAAGAIQTTEVSPVMFVPLRRP